MFRNLFLSSRFRYNQIMAVHYAVYASPIGPMYLRAEDGFLTGLCFHDQRHGFPLGPVQESSSDPALSETVRWLDLYYAGTEPAFTPPLRLSASPYRSLVLSLCRKIPYGETRTYGTLAEAAARRMEKDTWSARAAGLAVGANPIVLLIPCHRVVGKNGALTGYDGGMERKRFLLELETGNLSSRLP
jgi:methylated-DNA-[protein]-cysteine S-methyltransferase